jgi:hypothetical protein
MNHAIVKRLALRAQHEAFLLSLHQQGAIWSGHEGIECSDLWGTALLTELEPSDPGLHQSGASDSEYQSGSCERARVESA